jgi:hypothetical protein
LLVRRPESFGQQRPHAGQRLDDPGLLIASQGLDDLRVDVLDPLVQLEDLLSQIGNQGGERRLGNPRSRRTRWSERMRRR